MIFEDIEISMPNNYPKGILENKDKLVFYTLGNWGCECVQNSFFSFLSDNEIIERYKQVLLNYHIFATPENEKLPIEFHYSTWFWTKILYQLKMIFRYRKIELPKDTIKDRKTKIIKTSYKQNIMTLYRFSELEYNLDFIVNGRVRFALASNYEHDENKARNDNELKKRFIYSGCNSTIITKDGHIIPCIGEASSIFESYPYYVCCMSLQNNPLFYEEIPSYNSCVVIENYSEFYKRIILAFKNKFPFSKKSPIFSPVSYYNKFHNNVFDKNGLIPQLDKDIVYAWQEECRFVVQPENFNKEYFFLELGPLNDIAHLEITEPKENCKNILEKYNLHQLIK